MKGNTSCQILSDFGHWYWCRSSPQWVSPCCHIALENLLQPDCLTTNSAYSSVRELLATVEYSSRQVPPWIRWMRVMCPNIHWHLLYLSELMASGHDCISSRINSVLPAVMGLSERKESYSTIIILLLNMVWSALSAANVILYTFLISIMCKITHFPHLSQIWFF